MSDMYGARKPGRKKVPVKGDWRKERFLEWLCTAVKEREPRTQEELAQELSVQREQLSIWKRDKEFLAEWEAMYRRTVGSPERAQRVMDTLYKTATDPDDPKHVAAAKQYLEAIDAVKPQKIDVSVTRAAKDLTDDELDDILAAKISQERAS